ncbi:MAG: D-tyrosyl-tRNA(Tyr) deacylase [Firmicutes bacterium]|nr:D-tyrosyl-tRNA(Tyr) deacylase [Bacillota bacterium]MBQ9604277.1 D-tyrosyl-tRNA(Tyr) deacylase [Bacillota bacterium]
MRIVLQRVKYARVNVDGECVGAIERGVLALVGINTGDDIKVIDNMLKKMSSLRIFEDAEDKMNLSVTDIGGGILLVPNFTIYADARKGTRPSFAMGAKPDEAKEIFELMVKRANEILSVNVQSGIFQADMKVELLNDGPVTILLDSDKVV